VTAVGAPTGWSPVALSRDLPRGTACGVTVSGAALVLWRGTGGTVHAWEDRCPHRGMRLSFGFVRGDRIACIYHGWEYDTAGACRYIPAHPDLEVPATIRVERHAAAEAAGFVWVAAEGAGDAPPPAPPATALRSLYLDRPLKDAVTLLRETGLPGLGPVESWTRTGALVRFVQQEFDILAGLHAVDEDRCALHLGIGAETPAERLTVLVRATAALRRAAVAQPLHEVAAE
jgi:nitrite reductase/ring-hydroxylating ferredoxin subunit